MQGFENAEKEKLTIDLVRANIFGILLLFPILLVFGLPYYFLWLMDADIKSMIDGIKPHDKLMGILYMMGAMITGTVLHELIHGMVWARFAKNGFKSIKFGVLMSMLTPYCHCKEPLRVWQYIIGAIAPAVILGFLPAILAIITGNLGLLIFGMFFTMAAGGDILMIHLIRKENKNDWVQDHPSEAGCYVYRKKGD